MTLLIALALLLILMAAALRRAIPIALGIAAGSGVWSVSHDPLTTCVAGFATLCVSAAIMDLGAASSSPAIRSTAIGFEIVATAAASGLVAFMLLNDFQSGWALAMSIAFASLFGAGLILRRHAITN